MRGRLSEDRAGEIAIAALGFIAADRDLLDRFCAVTGIDAASLRQAAADPHFLPSVLDFVLAHEPTLMAFAGTAAIDPASVEAARWTLSPADEG